MTTVSENFRTERQRLKWSHAEIGKMCGVRQATVIAWEKGSKIPADALATLMKEGMDVYYVLVGRDSSAQQPLICPPDEVALVDDYRTLDDTLKEKARLYVEALAVAAMAQGKSAPRKRKPR